MVIINNASTDSTNWNTAPIERINARVEVSYVDAAKVGSFAVAASALPGLNAGDRIYVSSGGTGAYRTVLRVEPIAGGAVMISLDPGYANVAAPSSLE